MRTKEKLRKEFEDQVSEQGVERLFKTDNQHYIDWLENKLVENIAVLDDVADNSFLNGSEEHLMNRAHYMVRNCK